MTTPRCDEARIERFLLQTLTLREERELEQHLAGCEACCDQLQQRTAAESWWQQASQFLPDDADDLQALAPTPPPEFAEVAPRAAAGLPTAPLPAAVQTVLQMLAPTDDPRRLGRIGNYEVAGVVGAGGMSVVLKAFDGSLNRYVAIKVLAPHLATGGAARQRFAREAQAAAAIVHENVIAIHGVEEAFGLPYLVMPYVKGESLQTRLYTEGALELKEILRIAKQTAAGLAAAHAQGLIHRDVKPANILLADGVERVTITDFGLARAADDASLTRSGTIAGTPQYMSPEQARGEMVDQRSDLFSLGSVIYAMCTGCPPFRAESSYGVLRRISDAPPKPIACLNSEIPVWLIRLVDRLHAKLPEQRYGSAAEVAADLEQCLAHVQQPDRAPLPKGLDTSLRLRRVHLHKYRVLGVTAIALGVWLLAGVPHRQRDATPPLASEQQNQHGQEASAAAPAPAAPELNGIAASSPQRAEDASPSPFVPPPPRDWWADGTDRELRELEAATYLLEAELLEEPTPEFVPAATEPQLGTNSEEEL